VKPTKSSERIATLTSVRQFQSDIAAIREAGYSRPARAIVHILASLILAAVVVMALARVDRVVTSLSGKLVTTEPEVVFQALDPAIIKTINVHEGQRVEKGQLLATLDPTFAAAAVAQLKSQIDSLRTQIARDEAELAGRRLEFPPNKDPDFGKYQKVQTQLFNQQMGNYNAQVQSFDQKIALANVTIEKFRNEEGHYKDEASVAKQAEDMWTTLQSHGNGSLLSLLTTTNAKLETLRSMEFDHNSVIESEHSLASIQADRAAFVQQFRSTTSQDLVTQRNSLDAAEAQLDAALKHQELVRLVAPEPSVVLSIAKLSVGSVLKQGDQLMTLTPAAAAVEAEVAVATNDVAFLRPGDPAKLKIDAFNSAEHGEVEGKVSWIGEDAFTTDDNGNPLPAGAPPYYKARIAITAENLTDVPASFRLAPGMTFTADITVGARSLAMYILGGLVRTAGDSMREQ
jgi:HlyD family secretion protein